MTRTNDDRFRLWQRALALGFAVQALAGLAVAFAYDTPLFAWHSERVALALWDRPTFPAEAAALRDFLMGVLGATMFGSASAQLWVTLVPFARREPWAFCCVATGLLLWAPIDTGLSLAHGVWINAVFNLMPIAMMAVPLAMTWRDFWPASPR